MDSAKRYDEYWRERDEIRSRARSRSRAFLALRLLEKVGMSPGDPATVPAPSLYEIGCGPGWALEVFREAGFDVRGCDVSPEAVGRARELGLEVRCRDIEEAEQGEDPAEEGSDVLVALEVLEHLKEPLPVLKEMSARAAPGGSLVISLPNENHLLSRLLRLLGRPERGGEGDPHLHHFDRPAALRLFKDAGLRVLDRFDDSIAPPRMPMVRWLLSPLLVLMPGLFSLAHVFLLKAGREGQAA